MSKLPVERATSLSSVDKLNVYDEAHVSSQLGFDVNDRNALERSLFAAVNAGDREQVLRIFELYTSPTVILQLLLTTSYPNRDGFYKHDPEVLQDATELLGPSLEHLNVMHIACLLGDEEIAMDILEFVNRVTTEIEAKKVLFEFMGRVWGNGNTVLHLASFCGMSDLVKKLLELGAAYIKPNDRKYRPVDCADEDVTRRMFEDVKEVPQILTGTSTVQSPFKSDFESSSAPSSPTVTSRTRTVSLDSKSAKAPSPIVGRPRSKGSLNNLSKKPELASKSSLATSSHTDLKKPKKGVKFDAATALLDLCQSKDIEDCYSKIREALGLDGIPIKVNDIFSPQQHMTPLHLACSHGKLDVVEMLLKESGSNVNNRDREGWTALHCASVEGHLEILKLLLSCQGKTGDDTRPDIINVPDGPVDIWARNEDGDLFEDVAFESKADEILSLAIPLKILYPEPEYESQEGLVDDDDDDDEYESESDEEVEEKVAQGDGMKTNLSRSPSIMKATNTRRHTIEINRGDS